MTNSDDAGTEMPSQSVPQTKTNET